MGKLKNLFNTWLDSFTNTFGSLDKQNSSKKILIIDEIDVLFDRNYYGNTFNSSVSLQDESIKKLLTFVWENRDSPAMGVKFVKNSQEFKDVVKKYESLEEILENQINGMLVALKTFEDQQYYVVDRKIMYKGEDTISDKFTYGYNTVFAYLK